MCTALPSGSRMAPISSSTSAGRCMALKAGIRRYSAKAPGTLTPMPLVSGSRWKCPARAMRLFMPIRWPSPDTRSPDLHGAHMAADLGHRAGRIHGRPPSAREWSSAPTRPISRCGDRCRRCRSWPTLISISSGPIFGHRLVAHGQPLGLLRLDQRAHIRITPNDPSLARRVKAATAGRHRSPNARPTSGCGCGPGPCGTTGKKKPVT